MTNEKMNEKYHTLKINQLSGHVSEKEQAFLSFYENNVLKYGLSTEDKELAKTQAIQLFKALELN